MAQNVLLSTDLTCYYGIAKARIPRFLSVSATEYYEESWDAARQYPRSTVSFDMPSLYSLSTEARNLLGRYARDCLFRLQYREI